ncbi:NADH dehydrogenase subunit L [Planctobacterium marinum]|uniref:Probable inorganic carbon transporter subunit DabB n=1 Tax=Planctobacterium marinum TaxID=1631968 RepID=A0AA48KMT9_9ALTE|nr:NADH dehydrogenase subunit L [Planctobacterium marinum]
MTLWTSGLALLLISSASVLLNGNVISASHGALFKFTTVNSIILPLVMFIAMIILRFSHNYLSAEACYPRFFRWMMLTLTAVSVTLLTNHLVIFLLSWVAISLCLHKLLTLYPERPRAILAAHKKFILARLAELCLLGAFALLYMAHQTLFIDELLTNIGTGSAYLEHTAAVLIALAALIKCAQLPVHGWLIKVVEAPTPVSALLHAGIINLGGYLLILFSPLIEFSAYGRWTLLVIAGISTLLASLILLTRVSVKVRLAWSTSAQMGLMLIECALGLYSLALLHLVAHSLYKAFAFLNSGNAVNEQLQQELSGKLRAPARYWLPAGAFSLAVIAGAFTLFHEQGPIAPWVLLWMGITILMATSAQKSTAVIAAVVLTGCYVLLKTSFGQFFDGQGITFLSAEDVFACLVFINMFVFGLHLRFAHHKPWVQRLSAALFAGLYLDEWFTRSTLRFWPVAKSTLPLKQSQ